MSALGQREHFRKRNLIHGLVAPFPSSALCFLAYTFHGDSPTLGAEAPSPICPSEV